jgi:hypothetical protein
MIGKGSNLSESLRMRLIRSSLSRFHLHQSSREVSLHDTPMADKVAYKAQSEKYLHMVIVWIDSTSATPEYEQLP